MAIYEKITSDGIQIGTEVDYCFKCVKAGQQIKESDILKDKEVFKIHVNGLDYCLCLKHFASILGNYALVHKDTLVEGKDVLTIPKELAEDGTEQDLVDYIEKKLKAYGK